MKIILTLQFNGEVLRDERKWNRRTRRRLLFVRFDERSQRGNHFVVHLKQNSLGGSRPFGNETSECGLTRFTFRCPNTVGNFLEWSVPDYGACSIPTMKVTRRTCPPHEMHRGCRLVPTTLFNESASERQSSATFLIRETCFPRPRFYRNAFIIDYSKRYLSQCNFPHAR